MTQSAPVPCGQAAALADLKLQVTNARSTPKYRVITELVRLYWRIGRTILHRQTQDNWGTKVIGRLPDDLRAAGTETTEFSPRSLAYAGVRGCVAEEQVLQQAVAQLPGARHRPAVR